MSTEVYVDLMFAWGHARLGQVEAGRCLIDRARVSRQLALTSPIERRAAKVHDWLVDALLYRIKQATTGLAHDGPLPRGLVEELPEIRKSMKDRDRDTRYAIDIVRYVSRILEPSERVDPYLPWKRGFTASQRTTQESAANLVDQENTEESQDQRSRDFAGETLADLEAASTPVARRRAVTHCIAILSRQTWSERSPCLIKLIEQLPRFPNTWTTVRHYSRTHLEIVDRLVLLIATDGYVGTHSAVRSPPADEFPARRAALSQAHAKLMAWGRPDWGPTPNST